jgi:type I restriction enzyme R subunit
MNGQCAGRPFSPSGRDAARQRGFTLYKILYIQFMELKPKEFRRYLRKESTTAEKILWFHFRNRKFLDLKIRRQHTIENFVVDFYIDELKLIIEVDGSVHDNQGQSNNDYSRDQVLKSKGYSVVRIDNISVVDYTEAALKWIMDEIRKLKVQIKPA